MRRGIGLSRLEESSLISDSRRGSCADFRLIRLHGNLNVIESIDTEHRSICMAKPHRGLKKANHGARPANSKARKAKRKHIKT